MAVVGWWASPVLVSLNINHTFPGVISSTTWSVSQNH
jgi:hypothetical protein